VYVRLTAQGLQLGPRDEITTGIELAAVKKERQLAGYIFGPHLPNSFFRCLDP
jgi:type II secretory pathway component PulC